MYTVLSELSVNQTLEWLAFIITVYNTILITGVDLFQVIRNGVSRKCNVFTVGSFYNKKKVRTISKWGIVS